MYICFERERHRLFYFEKERVRVKFLITPWLEGDGIWREMEFRVERMPPGRYKYLIRRKTVTVLLLLMKTSLLTVTATCIKPLKNFSRTFRHVTEDEQEEENVQLYPILNLIFR